MTEGLELGALRYTVQRFVLLAIFAALLFHFANRWDWVRGWAYVVAVGLAEALTLAILAWRAPATLNERGKLHSKTAWFDWLFACLWLVLSLVTPIVAGLEVRTGAPLLSWTFFWFGTAVLLAAVALGAWAMLENEHFEQLVRIQDDRGHRAVETGPYRFVRHPGYLAAIVGALVTPLMLGTSIAFLPAGLAAVLFIWRTALEDNTLRRDLPGYADYAMRTQARLFPGLW
jgi:protein-S-isoprenylcysteine O-methyltransferase Ste14